jgi:O-antigen/teichoic acid export membrane protein
MNDRSASTTRGSRLIGVRSGLVLLIAGALANVCNFAFQILTARQLSVDEYGLLAGFMSAVTIICVSAAALQTAAARAVAAGENEPGRSMLSDHLTRSAVVFALALGAAIMVSSPWSGEALHIGELPILMLGFFGLAASLDAIANGRLQGSRRFGRQATYGLMQATGKLAAAATVLVVGYRVVGIVGALVITSLLIAVVGMYASRDLGAISTRVFSAEVRRSFAAVFLFWVMVSIDILIARSLWDPQQAGIYAAASVLGKAVLLLPAVISQVLFPHLAEEHAERRPVTAVMAKAILTVLAVTSLATLALALAGPVVVAVLYGERYQAAAPLAWQLGAAMIPFAIFNLLQFHYLARHQSGFIYAMLAAAIIELSAMYTIGTDGTRFAAILGLTGLALVIFVFPKKNLWPTIRHRSARRPDRKQNR